MELVGNDGLTELKLCELSTPFSVPVFFSFSELNCVTDLRVLRIIQAYFAKTVTVGATPFVTSLSNSAAIDPGGSPWVRGHLRPIEVWCRSCSPFGLWDHVHASFSFLRRVVSKKA